MASQLLNLSYALLLSMMFQPGKGDGASEGTSFAVTLPSQYYSSSPDMEVTFTAREFSATVYIDGVDLQDQLLLDAQSIATRRYDTTWCTRNGVHQTTIYVTSTEPISVSYSPVQAEYHFDPDGATVLPWSSTGTSFFLPGVPAQDYSSCTSYWSTAMGGYYTVAPFEDDTDVTVWRKSGDNWVVDWQLNINRYDAMTSTESGPMVRLINSTKPVSVASGNACMWLEPSFGTGQWQHSREVMLNEAEFGTAFVTMPVLQSHREAGYNVRVMASRDNTVVEALGWDWTLDRGDILDLDGENFGAWDSYTPFLVTCSEPCLALQFAKTDKAWGISGGSGMLTLTPVTLYNQDLVFHPPVYAADNLVHMLYLTVVAAGPGQIYLNDYPLRVLPNWSVVDGTYSVVTVDIEYEFYHLYTMDPDTTFAAYLLGTAITSVTVGGNQPHAILINLGYGSYSGAGIPTTTTSPPTVETLPPLYIMEFDGYFHSGPGQEPYSPECIEVYSESLQNKSTVVLAGVNAEIGDSLCGHLNNSDVHVVGSGIMFYAPDNTGVTYLSYAISSEGYVVIQDFINCVDELKDHLSHFDSWVPMPIIPTEPGCPPVIFDPRAFLPRVEHKWQCREDLSGDAKHAKGDDEEPESCTAEKAAYAVNAIDDYTVIDGPLDVRCSMDYTDSWRTEVLKMADTLADDLQNGAICSEKNGMVTIGAATSLFSTSGHEGIISATFYIEANSPSAKFDDLWECADDVFKAMENHADWPSAPIIPVPEGCPDLDYDDLLMKHDGEQWFCG